MDGRVGGSNSHEFGRIQIRSNSEKLFTNSHYDSIQIRSNSHDFEFGTNSLKFKLNSSRICIPNGRGSALWKSNAHRHFPTSVEARPKARVPDDPPNAPLTPPQHPPDAPRTPSNFCGKSARARPSLAPGRRRSGRRRSAAAARAPRAVHVQCSHVRARLRIVCSGDCAGGCAKQNVFEKQKRARTAVLKNRKSSAHGRAETRSRAEWECGASRARSPVRCGRAVPGGGGDAAWDPPSRTRGGGGAARGCYVRCVPCPPSQRWSAVPRSPPPRGHTCRTFRQLWALLTGSAAGSVHPTHM